MGQVVRKQERSRAPGLDQLLVSLRVDQSDYRLPQDWSQQPGRPPPLPRMEGSGVAVQHQGASVSQAPARADERRNDRRRDDYEHHWPATQKRSPHPNSIDEVAQ